MARDRLSHLGEVFGQILARTAAEYSALFGWLYIRYRSRNLGMGMNAGWAESVVRDVSPVVRGTRFEPLCGEIQGCAHAVACRSAEPIAPVTGDVLAHAQATIGKAGLGTVPAMVAAKLSADAHHYGRAGRQDLRLAADTAAYEMSVELFGPRSRTTFRQALALAVARNTAGDRRGAVEMLASCFKSLPASSPAEFELAGAAVLKLLDDGDLRAASNVCARAPMIDQVAAEVRDAVRARRRFVVAAVVLLAPFTVVATAAASALGAAVPLPGYGHLFPTLVVTGGLSAAARSVRIRTGFRYALRGPAVVLCVAAIVVAHMAALGAVNGVASAAALAEAIAAVVTFAVAATAMVAGQTRLNWLDAIVPKVDGVPDELRDDVITFARSL